MEGLEKIISAISAGAKEESFTSVSSSMLMLGFIFILATIPVIAAKIKKA